MGVVGDVTFPSFGASSSVDTQFEVSQPLAQTGTGAVNILFRTTREPDAVAPELRRVVSSIDRDLPVYGLVTARAAELRQTANLRLLANVLGGFALLGLVLRLGRVLASMMPNLPAPEFSIMVGALAFMVAVALAAFFIPAWRASKTNPMLVRRHE